MSQTQIAQVDIDLYLHVRVLISMILGLSVARLVGGVASLIHPTPHRVSYIHLGWVAWVLLNVLGFWWWEFRLRLIENWHLGLYMFVCLYASMYYFLSALLFSDHVGEHEGYLDYFMSRRIWFFGFAGLSEALDVVDTWIKGGRSSPLARNGIFRPYSRVRGVVRNCRLDPQPGLSGVLCCDQYRLRGQLFGALLLHGELTSGAHHKCVLSRKGTRKGRGRINQRRESHTPSVPVFAAA